MLLMPRRRKETARPLAGLELFNGCNDRELVRLQSLTTKIEFPPGRVLTRVGDRGREFFIISDGYADVRRDDQMIATLGPGSFFGEMALLDGGVRSATVTATTRLEVHVLSEREFRCLLSSSSTVTHNMLRVMAERLRDAA
jgi:CRP-like cAMP-binding protein